MILQCRSFGTPPRTTKWINCRKQTIAVRRDVILAYKNPNFVSKLASFDKSVEAIAVAWCGAIFSGNERLLLPEASLGAHLESQQQLGEKLPHKCINSNQWRVTVQV